MAVPTYQVIWSVTPHDIALHVMGRDMQGDEH